MKFDQSGLPGHPLVEKAFGVAYAHVTQGEMYDEGCKTVRGNIERIFAADLADAREDLGAAACKAKEQQIDREKNAALKTVPEIVAKALETNFEDLCVYGAAREILDFAEMASPTALAAAILYPVVRHEADIQKFAKVLSAEGDGAVPGGPDVISLLTALHKLGRVQDTVNSGREFDDDPGLYEPGDLTDEDMMDDNEIHPSLLRSDLSQASTELKVVYLAKLSADTVRELQEDRVITRREPLKPGRAEEALADAQALKGADELLERRFRNIFNELAILKESRFQIRVDRVGDLSLTEVEPPQLRKVQPKEQPEDKPRDPVTKTKPEEFTLN